VQIGPLAVVGGLPELEASTLTAGAFSVVGPQSMRREPRPSSSSAGARRWRVEHGRGGYHHPDVAYAPAMSRGSRLAGLVVSCDMDARHEGRGRVSPPELTLELSPS
jgi:hypothetical protein